MAEIKFTGFVEDWTKNSPVHPDWAMRVTEPHRKKDGDNWVTVGRTYRTVKAAYEVTIDFTRFAKGDRVEVIGTEVTETTERDGKRYDNLIVKATEVTVLPARGGSTASATNSDWASPLASLGATEVEAPF